MYTLACPQSRVRTNPSAIQHFSLPIGLLLAVAVSLASTGCSPLKSAVAPQAMMVSASLPAATQGQAYSGLITANGGTAPYNFRTSLGQLPPGLVINASTGAISGTPKTAGSYKFTILVADTSGDATGTQDLIIIVKPPVVIPPVEVVVSPASVTLAPGGTHQFLAVVSNSGNPAVTWAVSAGSITSMGMFTAPTTNAPATVRLTATSKADPSKQGEATITITGSAPAPSSGLAMTGGSLPDATEGVPYSAGLHASGGKAPLQWKLSAGSLPSGLALGSDGAIQGITHQPGTASFTASVQDASGQSVAGQFSLTVITPNSGNFDGPAELPRIFIKSSLADTPAPGATHSVDTSAALQAALNSASCGDTISIKAGATLNGRFVLPAKNCDDNHWIILRSSAPESALPPEGTRVTPCYAGVSSLPGRPALGCRSTANVLAKLVFTDSGSGPIAFADGANHYRLLRLELTRPASSATVYSLVDNANGSSDHIVYDRLWLHGTAQDETTRGIMLAGSTYTAIVDSFFSDFHCVAMTGACGDSQAIAGGLGDRAMGPHKIVNNYLEAAGENIIFGGGEATKTPEDIEIRRNFFFKPMIWMKGTPGFVGGHDGSPFIVKNHFELKNGARVLVEGNVIENSWGGFTQTGFSVLLTPKNQNGQCPLCVVHDITIRYTTMSHLGNGITIGNGASDSGALSQGAWNESLHDLIITDVDGTAYNGTGHLIQEGNSNPQNPLHDVAIAHVTGLLEDSTVAMLVIGNEPDHPLAGFSWTNNIFTGTGGGILSTGGGATNCAYPGFGNGALGKIERCFKPYTFAGNVLIGASGPWPSDNKAPATLGDVMFSGNNAHDPASFQLQAASPFRNSGTDGKDPGADVVALQAAIAGVAP